MNLGFSQYAEWHSVQGASVSQSVSQSVRGACQPGGKSVSRLRVERDHGTVAHGCTDSAGPCNALYPLLYSVIVRGTEAGMCRPSLLAACFSDGPSSLLLVTGAAAPVCTVTHACGRCGAAAGCVGATFMMVVVVVVVVWLWGR